MTKYMTPTQKAFEYYKIFNAVKLHFTQKSYNIKDSKGRINIPEENFENKDEASIFKSLTKLYPVTINFREVVVANILKNRKVHSSFLLSDEAKTIRSKWISRVDFLCYNFENEIGKLINTPINDMFYTDGMNLPLIIKKYIDNTISLETLVILYRFTNLKKKYCNSLKDNFVYQEVYHLIYKYSLLLDYDIIKMKHVVSNMLGKWVSSQNI